MTNINNNDFIMPTYKRWPVEFVSGSGAELVDAEGRRYLDFVGGIAVASVGHAHPAVAEAVSAQVRRLVHVSNLYETGPQKQLSERLAQLTSGMLSFFCNSGAESIECALKLARRWARKSKGPEAFRVVAAQGSFHGRTFGALAATGQPAKQEPFAPMLEGFTHVPYGDAGALEDAMGSEVAAVLLEPIQGEAGVVVPPDDYLPAARALCDEHGALLIVDEVQTGIARTGRMWAHEHWSVTPDVMCLAKALAGGLPMGACLGSPEVVAALEPGDHASTFGGGPVQSSAALAVLDIVEREGLVERAALLGERLMKGLESIAPADATVRGRGLLIGLDLGGPSAHSVAEALLERRVLVNDATANVVRFAPPLVIKEAAIDEALTTVEEALHAL